MAAADGPGVVPSLGQVPATRRVRAALAWAATIGLLVLWAVTLRPVALGGPASFIGVRGISMEPTFHEGDLVVTRAQGTYRHGDVVAYRIPEGEPGEGHNIVHRIVGGDGQRGYITRGDHNSYTDTWHPVDGDVIGRVWTAPPNLAQWAGRLRSPMASGVLVAVVAFLVMVLPERSRRERVRSARA